MAILFYSSILLHKSDKMNHAKNKGRVHPGQVGEEGLVNGGFEMDSVNEEKSTTKYWINYIFLFYSIIFDCVVKFGHTIFYPTDHQAKPLFYSCFSKVVEKMRLAGGLTDKKNPLIMIPNLKAGAARWREYINSRRTLSVPG